MMLIWSSTRPCSESSRIRRTWSAAGGAPFIHERIAHESRTFLTVAAFFRTTFLLQSLREINPLELPLPRPPIGGGLGFSEHQVIALDFDIQFGSFLQMEPLADLLGDDDLASG